MTTMTATDLNNAINTFTNGRGLRGFIARIIKIAAAADVSVTASVKRTHEGEAVFCLAFGSLNVEFVPWAERGITMWSAAPGGSRVYWPTMCVHDWEIRSWMTRGF